MSALPATPTLSALVRSILVSGGNKPVRLNSLWDAVRAQPQAQSVSKTHFKRRVIGQMFVRDEVCAAQPLLCSLAPPSSPAHRAPFFLPPTFPPVHSCSW